mgnify:CR=1 FL=1
MDAGGRATQDAEAEGARGAGEDKSGRAPIQLELVSISVGAGDGVLASTNHSPQPSPLGVSQ